jgi:hypothetical protein
MMVVQIEKPANITLAVWFTELRSWLDSNRCEPTLFSPSGRIMNNILFNITFENDNHAGRFASAFKKYAPTTRRTIGTERVNFLRETREMAISDAAGPTFGEVGSHNPQNESDRSPITRCLDRL